MTRRLAILTAVLLLPVALSAKERRQVDKKAMAALKAADKLIYRPMSHGLKDMRFEFNVKTIKGEMRCLWMFRAGSKKESQRQLRTIKNVADRKTRRKYTAGLAEWFDIVSFPILMKPYMDEVEGMNVEWSDKRGGQTVLTPVDPAESRYDRIAFVWNTDGLPREVSWSRTKEDPDEGPYRVELTESLEWLSLDRFRFVSFVNSTRTGSPIIARYEYGKVGRLYLPTKVTRISVFEGEDEIQFFDLRVNKGISDEEFARYR